MSRPHPLKSVKMFIWLAVIAFSAGLYVYKLIYGGIDYAKDIRLAEFILLLNVTATYFMTGLIWNVQLVNYPLFNQIGKNSFASYHFQHVRRITGLVAFPMSLELATSLLMVYYPYPGVADIFIFWGVFLNVFILLSTIFLQIPQHEALLKEFEAQAYQKLVKTNWIRTAAWTARSSILAVILLKIF